MEAQYVDKALELGPAGTARRADLLNPLRWAGRLAEKAAYLRLLLVGSRRRRGWFLDRLTLRKFVNMTVAGAQFALKSERMAALPVAVKIDISPMCNLSCTVCVHADPNGNESLEKQRFHARQRMTVDQYRRIIDEIKGSVCAVSLYYLGDPLVHPDLDEMCAIAYKAGLNVHISTNFSFSLTDARLRRMVRSGLTHLTVCVDGLSQEKYQMTRVGGRIDLVLSNLRRVCRFREELGREFPKVEVQYIKFQHNVDELEAARALFEDIGVDQVVDFWGDLHNYTDGDPDHLQVFGPLRPRKLPLCFWPHTSIVIKYNGDVIPCCTYRLGHQYTEVDHPRILGNIFRTSLRQVWNSEQYRQARRLVSNPEAVHSDPRLKDHFCYGCPALFQTDDERLRRNSAQHRHDDLYVMAPDGRPIRRPGEETGLPDRGRLVQLGLPGDRTAGARAPVASG